MIIHWGGEGIGSACRDLGPTTPYMSGATCRTCQFIIQLAIDHLDPDLQDTDADEYPFTPTETLPGRPLPPLPASPAAPGVISGEIEVPPASESR